MTTASARHSKPTIRVACKCGKAYRVAASREGKRVTCGACAGTIRVPARGSISARSRQTILAELGIETGTAARRPSGKGRREERKPRTFECQSCRSAVDDSRGAYVNGELLCLGCRSVEIVVDRRALQEESLARAAGTKRRASSVRAPELGPVASAIAHTILFFAGSAGPLCVVFGASGALSLAVGVTFALAGGFAVYRARARRT
jgi:hypothetical protein